MLRPRIKLHSRQLRVFSAIFLLLISGVLILARWNGSDANSSAPSQGKRDDSKLEAELVTVTPTGFEPAEITRPHGRFLLAIDNRSGLDSVDFYLEREAGTRAKDSFARKGKLAWREVIDLPPGTYILRAANDESWQCRIVLTAR